MLCFVLISSLFLLVDRLQWLVAGIGEGVCAASCRFDRQILARRLHINVVIAAAAIQRCLDVMSRRGRGRGIDILLGKFSRLLRTVPFLAIRCGNAMQHGYLLRCLISCIHCGRQSVLASHRLMYAGVHIVRQRWRMLLAHCAISIWERERGFVCVYGWQIG